MGKHQPVDDLVATLQQIAVDAEGTDVPDVGPAVNVWLSSNTRYPYTTIYPPDGRWQVWLWGPSFEHQAPGDVTMPDLAEAIKKTLPSA